MERQHYLEMRQNVDNLITSGCLKDKKIYIMGHCKAAERLFDYLKSNDFHVAAFLDNNEHKLGKAYLGVKICRPEEKLIPLCHESVIMIISRHYESMAFQLRNMGYDKQTVKIVDFDSLSEFSTTEETFQKHAARIAEGSALLTSIKRKHKEAQIVVSPYNALGDVYMLCAYLGEYCRANQVQVNKLVIIVTGQTCGDIPPMFGYHDVEVLTNREMDMLVQAVVFLAAQDVWILHHDRPYTNVNIRISDKYPVTFNQHYPCCVFGLNADAPKKRLGKSGKHTFNELEKGRTVILSPYAKSMTAMPEEYWEDIVSEYKAKGYKVVTNITGEEQAVNGTTAVSYPIREMIDAVEYAGHFVGIRSGLCDIIENAECEKRIIYPEGKYSTTQMEISEFFSKNSLNCGSRK